MKVRR